VQILAEAHCKYPLLWSLVCMAPNFLHHEHGSPQSLDLHFANRTRKMMVSCHIAALSARRTDTHACSLFGPALELTKQVQRFEGRSHFVLTQGE
jgi:hypothetical protein